MIEIKCVYRFFLSFCPVPRPAQAPLLDHGAVSEVPEEEKDPGEDRIQDRPPAQGQDPGQGNFRCKGLHRHWLKTV